jgi:outer membrane protease
VRTIYGFFLFVSIFGVISFASLYAEESENFPYTFSLGTSAGFLYGEGEEIVYLLDGNYDRQASQLIWDIKPMIYFGSSLYFDQVEPLKKWGFFGALDLKFGLPGIMTGTMEDRDWDFENKMTDFSSHDNTTEGALLLDFAAGVSFPIRSTLYIRGYGVISYMHFKWTSRGGYSQKARDFDPDSNAYVFYPSAKDAPERPVYGPAINYSQDWFELALGLSVHYPFLKNFTLSLSTQFVPLIVMTHGRDDHLKRDTQFDDYMSKGASFKPRGELSFSPTPRLSISLFVGGIFMFEVSGPSYLRYSGIEGTYTPSPENNEVTGDHIESPLDAGAAFTAMDMGLLFKIKL